MNLAQRIEAAIASPADALLVAFFDPAGPFAGSTFDHIPDNPRDRFTSSDLVAASLLDVRFEPRAVRAILADEAEELGELLHNIPDDLDLWAATDQHLAAAERLYRALEHVDGIGPTRASKLLARKRPRLVPIIDSVVRRGLALGEETWDELRAALQQPRILELIEDIRPPGVLSPVSTLRLLDAAVWMRYSGSRNAKRVQATVGL